MADQPYQSLYRRYRPARFSELRGQDHIARTLRNAVREGRVGHAYLFSGPRGTGKTSTARILAKALNCTNLQDGEPCGECESCVQLASGTSLDVHELDAASNNGVDAMRDLVSRAALGTPGRWKVYIVDEVHMLTQGASNALLKTLEEPPAHVIFVLATTDPQKVLATIRSRTQSFEFRLLPPDVLGDLLKDINADAGLGVPTEAIDLVVRRGKGSARDALSVLDQVAAAGGIEDEVQVSDEIVEALAERDTGRALAAVAQGCAAGKDARRLAEELLGHLREGFLATMARSLVDLPDDAAVRVEEQGRRLGAPGLTRAMEVIGDALTEMREALDPRVCLEVALVRLTRPEVDASLPALLERIERLERGAPRTNVPATEGATADPPAAEASAQPAGPSGARAALGAMRKKAPPASAAANSAAKPVAEAPASKPSSKGAATAPSRDDLTTAWADEILPNLPSRPRARFKLGRWVDGDDGQPSYALPNDVHKKMCEEVRADVEQALVAYFGTRVPLRLVIDAGQTAAPPDEADVDEGADFEELRDAPAAVSSTPEDRLKAAFPGAEEVDQ